jgi:hypothetical protein
LFLLKVYIFDGSYFHSFLSVNYETRFQTLELDKLFTNLLISALKLRGFNQELFKIYAAYILVSGSVSNILDIKY